MPGVLLTPAATVICPHGAPASPSVLDPRVRVLGSPVVPAGSTWTVAGCPSPPPPGGPGPCLSATFSAGTHRVLVDGLPVLLDDSKSACVQSGLPLIVLGAQSRVRAN